MLAIVTDLPIFNVYIKAALIKSSDKLGTDGKQLISFVLSLSNRLCPAVSEYERKQLAQSFLKPSGFASAWTKNFGFLKTYLRNQ